MKILSIRIKNLASLEGLTEIQFTREPLLSAGIFAITGPTGAGKSTILDALCLALYAKTPRYVEAKETGIEITDVQGSTKGQGDVRGILRDGTGNGFAEVDFEGIDGHRYRATWQIRRSRDKATGSLQAFTIALKNIDTNLDFPGNKREIQEEIERLVGLNFEQFTRSVLLAQGDFTAFLKAAKDEKSALLEKLTGTEVYSEISKQIFAHCRLEERVLDDLHLQRTGISTFTREEIEQFEKQRAATESIIATQEKETGILNQEIAWHTQLAVLKSGLSEANTARENAQEAKEFAKERERELKYTEQAQATKTWVDNRKTIKEQLFEKSLSAQQLIIALEKLQQQQEQLDAELQQASQAVNENVKKQEDAVPGLAKARELDIKVTEKAAQVNHASNECTEAGKQFNQQGHQLGAQQRDLVQLHASIESLRKWQNENTSRRAVAENHNVISSKLNDATGVLDALRLLEPQLESTNAGLDEIIKVKAVLDATSHSVTEAVHSSREALSNALAALSGIPITTIENEKAAIDRILKDAISANAHWKILFNSRSILHALKEKLDRNKSELNNKIELQEQTAKRLITLTAERDTSLRILHTARLAATENAASFRLQLIPGDACPVCGNTEHPYATENPQLDHVLAQMEAAHKEHDTAYTTGMSSERGLRDTANQLKKLIKEQEQEELTGKAELERHIKTWEEFDIHEEATRLPEEERAGWLARQVNEKTTQLQNLQNEIKSYGTKKQESDELQQALTDAERKLSEHTNTVKDTERNLQLSQQQLSQYHKETLNYNKALAEIEQSLSVYFPSEGWYNHWKEDPALFLQRINEFSEKWKTNTKELEGNMQKYSVLAETLRGLQEKVQGLLTDLQKKQSTLKGFKEQEEALMEERKTLFNGEPASTVELRLKQGVTAAQQALEKAKADQVILQTETTRKSAEKEQTDKEISSLQAQQESVNEKIQLWLTAFNDRNNTQFGEEKLLQLLAFGPDRIEAERAALRLIDDAVTKSLSVIAERSNQLQQHEQKRLSEKTAEEVNELFSTAKTFLEQKIREKTEIGFTLQQDVQNKQRIGGLLDLIEAQGLIVEKWAKLNEVIGSADGKKFRQIAQEYTLDVLLSYANIHLEMLSKRYLLQRVRRTLGLQVLDRDMGDEVRTIHSLSGGESFLASLALALGLASLSSNRMQVESLFIDEGFGALDPATLNIAMDALENLHSQGRKVGVISHVQEMTERIPVQIRVSKMNSGRSKIEVNNIF